MKVLAISRLCPSPGVERHLFVHEQLSVLPIWNDALASSIAKVLDDPAKAAAIGVAGRAAALESSWERDAQLTLAAYERVHATTP